jgi:hypothetical protein
MAEFSRLADLMKERTQEMRIEELAALDQLSEYPQGLGVHQQSPGLNDGTTYFLQFVKDGIIYRQLFTGEGELGMLMKVDASRDDLLAIEDLIAEGDIMGVYGWEQVAQDELPSDVWMKGLLAADVGSADWFESIRGEIKKLSHTDVDWTGPEGNEFFDLSLYGTAAEQFAAQSKVDEMLAHGDEIVGITLGVGAAAAIGATNVVSSVVGGVASGVSALGDLSKKWFDQPAAPTKAKLVEARSRTAGGVDDGAVFRGTSQASADELSDTETGDVLTSKMKQFRRVLKMAHSNTEESLLRKL